MSTPTSTPVVFIHGLWIHSSAWLPWQNVFREAGYEPSAPGWPGDKATVAETRANAAELAGVGIEQITASYSRAIAALTAKPIVIGHSFGGLIAQKLLASGEARAAIAIDPAQIKGVKPLPFAQIRSGLPVLKNPANRNRAVSLTSKQFRYGFGNAISETESNSLYSEWTIPGPGRPLSEASAANFSKSSPAAVDTIRSDRGPLLIIAGGKDHTVPEVVAKAAFRLYAGSRAVTDFRVFPDRGHSLVLDSGWRAVADASLSWLASQSL
ncbi:alpha/beta hydrolase [Leifsonia shinshuensis]|uniref:alpha/beta hydrolase n=1 Tax=Leifsonia shinshuensis TaxID=150026 RepID=UPI0028665917|nr:alpha/beta hydrolase [Leifsonia shinshuensis]MDR6972891.1 pimeloyl-ACP methyl ester carboxylesterase [Leifsonia shinshuensis]